MLEIHPCTVQFTISSLKVAPCTVQMTTSSIKVVPCTVQLMTLSLGVASCTVQLTTWSLKVEPCTVQLTTSRLSVASCTVQMTTWSIQPTRKKGVPEGLRLLFGEKFYGATKSGRAEERKSGRAEERKSGRADGQTCRQRWRLGLRFNVIQIWHQSHDHFFHTTNALTAPPFIILAPRYCQRRFLSTSVSCAAYFAMSWSYTLPAGLFGCILINAIRCLPVGRHRR